MSTLKLTGVGRLVQNPALREVGKTVVLDFTLAVDDFIKKSDGTKEKITHFLDFQAWDKGAEVIAQYAKKGDLLFVQASPRKDVWEKEGEKRSKVYFRVDEFNFLSTKKKESTDPVPSVEEDPGTTPY